MKTCFSILFAGTALLLVEGCDLKRKNLATETPNAPGIPVRAQAVQVRPQATFEEVVGTVRAKLRATLEARVSGSIEQMPIALGQSVNTGDLIARLHAPEVRARLEQTQANFQQSEKDWKRISGLFAQQAVTHSEF